MVFVNDYDSVLNCMQARGQSEFIHIKIEIGTILREILFKIKILS